MKPHRFYYNRLLLVMLTPILILVLGVGLLAQPARSGGPANGDLTAAIDDIMSKTYKPDHPGAAVIAVKDGKVVFRKGYGMANLELGVPIRPEMVFRLGSITKQFTTVAILMLAEQGKLSVTDEITKYLPDFPTQGHKITIENLLTHTSGVKNYTSLPEWLPLWRKDMTVTDLIALFKDKPLDFAPGEKWSYSNSGYILLGAIIEKVSGQKYEDFIEKRIFAPIGMTHSFYDHTDRLIPGRVQGYSKDKDGFVNCAYLSMTQPYSAGSLASSVDDLALWDQALYTEKLVKQESLKRAWTTFHLNNGKPTNYGYGWGISLLDRHPVIAHDGGINGFATSGLRLPEIHGYVAVLTNLDSAETGPDDAAAKIALLLLGNPYKEPTPIDLPAGAIDRYVGRYQLEDGPMIAVTKEDGKLFITLGHKVEIIPMSETGFFSKGSMNRLEFTRDDLGAVTGLKLKTVMGIEMAATKSNK
jgi:D-alanyl-D-alanine carboxypeptidase